MAIEHDDSLPLAGTVLLRQATQYGTPVFLPGNSLAHALCEFRGALTFTPGMINRAKQMGFVVQTMGESPRRL